LYEVFGVVLIDSQFPVKNTRARSADLLLEHFNPARRVNNNMEEETDEDLFRRPEVPGFWPSNGLVGISFTVWGMAMKKGGTLNA
jgi:hypothetical protein